MRVPRFDKPLLTEPASSVLVRLGLDVPSRPALPPLIDPEGPPVVDPLDEPLVELDGGRVGVLGNYRLAGWEHARDGCRLRASVADPIDDATVNVLGTIRVLEGARRSGVRKVVLASSGGTLYGDADPALLPFDESVDHRPESPYGGSKSAAGTYLRVYEALYGLSWTELALANVYGARQDPHGEAGVVAIFAGRLLAGEPCTVYGTGGQTRDFVFVDDVVEAFIAAADTGDGCLFNIGTGVESSVNDLYSTMASTIGGPSEPGRAPARHGELERSALDPGHAAQVLGWRPTTDLAEGVRRTIDWFRQSGR